ncbi:MAG TPA: mannose-1-phosphate guanylyltransferase/mannose-6-phosphate isomerase [Rhizomicrobium sp.]|nr:mannose-1-phosphate guanylyltransferase/mannose-6-phosphate isomerase [Rhizomicrobium sp.]
MGNDTIYPVILSGGSGTRLWPLSRTSLPKQLLALHGERTMIQDTVLRALVPGAAAPVLLCGDDHRFIVADQMLAVDVKPAAIVLEPVGRNTAPAAAVAALMVAESDPKGVVLLLPSDHVVTDRAAFHAAVQKAASAARDGYIVTFGVKADRPETGYGYIQVGAPSVAGAHIVTRFAEKPDAQTAAGYIASGDYVWNSGMFVFRADVMLAELDRHAPGIVETCRKALASGKRDPDFVRLDQAVFGTAQNISIDFAVMEKTDKAAVVPCDLGWSDVGSWSSLWSLEQRDASGNVLQGDVVVHDSHDSYVRNDKGLTALVGVRDVVVVVTDDAVLVSDKNRAQDVKAVVDQLKSGKRPEAKDHATVFRPWGSYKGIDIGDRFQVKHIMVKPGGRLSLQMHHKRAEHWIVVEGTARVTNGDDVFTLRENESTFIPLGAKHRLENMGKEPLHLIEVQCGSYLGEDDIVRFDDVYGRVPEGAAAPSGAPGKK